MALTRSPLLKLQNIHCDYSGVPILSGVDFDLEPGEIACLLGPSGCGKTTALRAIAGFVGLSQGIVQLDSQVISEPGYVRPPESRGIGMVFQDYALFPHLSVEANIRFGLGDKSENQIKHIVKEMLSLVGLSDKASSYPHELSGGQQQRVALARALAPEPRLLLMDEPFSNLDADLRRQLSLEMKVILKRQGIAAILVTHDQQEAFTLSDKIGVLFEGKVQQWGTPAELFYSPDSPEIARFLSLGTLLKGTVCDSCCLETELGMLEFAAPLEAEEGEAVSIYLRPTDLHLSANAPILCQIEQVEFQGIHTLYHLKTPAGNLLQVSEHGVSNYTIGKAIGVSVAAHRPIIFKQSERLNLSKDAAYSVDNPLI